jgi:hypothetical protein
MLGKEALSVHLEELGRLHRVGSCDIVKGHGRDVVGLPFANQRVVLEKILLFGLIAARLSVKDSSSLGSVKAGESQQAFLAFPRCEWQVLRNVFKLHLDSQRLTCVCGEFGS